MPSGVKGFQVGHKPTAATRMKIGAALRRPIYFNCDNCGTRACDKPSSYVRKKRHFCSRSCYAHFVKSLPFHEQNAYRGVRQIGESSQVYHRRNVKNNPQTIKHLKARYYARRKGAEGSHTRQEWENLKEKHSHKCAWCQEVKPLTKDHIVPISNGGSDYIVNIQPLCRNCNSRKWTFTQPKLT